MNAPQSGDGVSVDHEIVTVRGCGRSSGIGGICLQLARYVCLELTTQPTYKDRNRVSCADRRSHQGAVDQRRPSQIVNLRQAFDTSMPGRQQMCYIDNAARNIASRHSRSFRGFTWAHHDNGFQGVQMPRPERGHKIDQIRWHADED